jgi:ribonuclease BN (tRNA processing enzyme)
VGIYGPPGTEALTAAGLNYYAIPEAIFSEQLPKTRPMHELFQAHDLDVTTPKVVYQDDKVRVLAVENSHYSTMHMPKQAYGTAKSYSYRFETPDRVVVFTGDTGPSEGLEKLAEGADVLVSEAINIDETLDLIRKQWRGPEAAIKPLVDHMRLEHFTPDEIGKLAAKAKVGMVVLTHLAPGLDEDLDSSAFTTGVRRTYPGPVVAARDLDQF